MGERSDLGRIHIGKRKLSAVIACYRDAPAVPIMYERLTAVFNKIGVDYEIIFVNDCSPDNAREVLADLAGKDKKVVVINHTRNLGFPRRLHKRHAYCYRRCRRPSGRRSARPA